MPRCYIPEILSCSEVVLVGFCDASEKGYAAVIYIRGDFGDEKEVRTNFVSSKTKVAPIAKQTIQRLELLGALLLAMLLKRVMDILVNTIQINRAVCLTDSAVVLHWIVNNQKKYKKYVGDRVEKIRKLLPGGTWLHVAGKENSADLPSRGCNPDELQTQLNEWVYGRDWLKKDMEEWPVRTVDEVGLSDEARKNFEKELKVEESTKVVVGISKDEHSIQKIVDSTRYSSLDKLLRITSYCPRFVRRCKEAVARKKDGAEVNAEKPEEEVTAEEITESKRVWIRALQEEVKKETKFKQMKDSLGIGEDPEGFLRCVGRLGRSKAPFEAKHPLILPTNNWVTTLLIRDAHEAVFHNKVKETLVELRSKHWVVRGKQKVKSVVDKCRLCKILEGLSYPAPTIIELPEFRVQGGRVFRSVGVDVFGPAYVFDVYDEEGENKQSICCPVHLWKIKDDTPKFSPIANSKSLHQEPKEVHEQKGNTKDDAFRQW